MQDLQDWINASNKELLPAIGKAQRQLSFGVVKREGLAKERPCLSEGLSACANGFRLGVCLPVPSQQTALPGVPPRRAKKGVARQFGEVREDPSDFELDRKAFRSILLKERSRAFASVDRTGGGSRAMRLGGAQEFDCKIALIPFESFPAKEVVRGRVDRFEKKRMLLRSFGPLKVSQAITVEYEDMLILGEVLACAPGAGETWACFIKVEQVLTALQSLLRLREQLLGSQAEGPARRPLREDLVLAA